MGEGGWGQVVGESWCWAKVWWGPARLGGRIPCAWGWQVPCARSEVIPFFSMRDRQSHVSTSTFFFFLSQHGAGGGAIYMKAWRLDASARIGRLGASSTVNFNRWLDVVNGCCKSYKRMGRNKMPMWNIYVLFFLWNFKDIFIGFFGSGALNMLWQTS